MTEEELQAIKARAEAASPGRWVSWCVEPTPSNDWAGKGMIGNLPLLSVGRSLAFRAADAEFMAAAREDVPALVAEVERLKAAYARCSERFWAVAKIAKAASAEAAQLRAARGAAFEEIAAALDQFTDQIRGLKAKPQESP